MKFTVDISDDLAEAIKAAAAADGVTRAEWVRAALKTRLQPTPSRPIPSHPAAGVGPDAPDAPDLAADLACRLARVEGVAEERLHHLEGAYQTIARLTPEADRTPAPLIRQGPTWREKLRAAWPWPRRARP